MLISGVCISLKLQCLHEGNAKVTSLKSKYFGRILERKALIKETLPAKAKLRGQKTNTLTIYIVDSNRISIQRK